jgi:SH3-like domain-containing protein
MRVVTDQHFRTSLRFTITALTLGAVALPGTGHAERTTPYWASIRADKARMRSGPGRRFPIMWVYLRAGLPVKVLRIYPNWRKVEGPGGSVGWMHGNLLSLRRTAVVRGGIGKMRSAPKPDARVIWRAKPDVIGALKRCSDGWCLFDVKGRTGYIEIADIWGATPGKRLP